MSILKKIHWNFKLLALLIIIAIIPATIIVTNVLGIIQDELKSNINNQLIFSSDELVIQIDNHYRKSFEVIDLLKQNLSSENLGPNERLNLLLSIIKSVDNIVGIAITLETDGKIPQEVISAYKDSVMVEGKNIPLDESVKTFDDSFERTPFNNFFIARPVYYHKLKLWRQAVKVDLPLKTLDNLFLYVYLNDNSIANYIESHPLNRNGTIFVSNVSGEILFSNGDDSSEFEFLLDDINELVDSPQRAAIVNNYSSPERESIVACFAFPQDIPWVITTAIKESDAYGVVTEIVGVFSFWLAISLITAIMFSFWFSRRLSSPIKKMSAAALNIAKGNFSTKIDYEAKDSIGALGKSLVEMSNELRSNFEEITKQRNMLEDYSKNLEKKVEARTSELVKANDEINRSYKKVLELNKEKNEFLGIAAHDLKNPLTIIKGYTEIISDDTSLPEDLKKSFLDEIKSASNRMFDIITNLLDVNAIEEGKVKINKQKVLLDEILSEVVAQNSHNASRKNIKIHSNGSQGTYIFADRSLTIQIIDNLISNAIKFSPNNKNIFIKHETIEAGKTVQLSIKDEGQGFSDEDMKKVFGKFARLSAKPTGGENSTGLGLSIVKKLIELQNASIVLESELGKGATFIIDFPEPIV